MSQWILTPWSSVAWVLAAAAGIYVAFIVIVRILGIRSIAQMEAYDFASTVAVGTILGGTATGSTSVLRGTIAISALLGLQTLIGWLRIRHNADEWVDNRPQLLVRHGMLDEERLAAERLTRSDLHYQLRRHGIWRLEDAELVILETTGQVSVKKAGGPGVDARLLEGVEGAT